MFAALLADSSAGGLEQLRRAAVRVGAPDDARLQLWRRLLGLDDVRLGREQWAGDTKRRRTDYIELKRALLGRYLDAPTAQGDALLVAVANDAVRTQTALAFFAQPLARAPIDAIDQALSERLELLSPTLATPRRAREARHRYSTVSSASNPSRPRSPSSVSSYTLSSPASELDADSSMPWQVILRALFLFATLNPIGYVQGMNELAAPLLYVLAQDPDGDLEADLYLALSNLLLERDLAAVMADPMPALGQLSDRLAAADEGLAEHFLATDVRPSFYAIRWLVPLFAQEFALPDLLRLWDALLGSSDTLDLALDLCASIVLGQRERLIGCSFPRCLAVLQSAPAQREVVELLESAILLGQERQAAEAMANVPTSVKLASTARNWLSQRAVQFSQSDASAALSKTATNARIAALQYREAAPAKLEALKAKAVAAAASTREQAVVALRPPSPDHDAPFFPPSWQEHAALLARAGSVRPSTPPLLPRQSSLVSPPTIPTPPRSPGLQPLLLSNAARRASMDRSRSHSPELRPRAASVQVSVSTPSPFKASHGRTASYHSPSPAPAVARAVSPPPPVTSPTHLPELNALKLSTSSSEMEVLSESPVIVDRPRPPSRGVSLVDEPISRRPPTRADSLPEGSPVAVVSAPPQRKSRLASTRTRTSHRTSYDGSSRRVSSSSLPSGAGPSVQRERPLSSHDLSDDYAFLAHFQD